MKMLIFIQATSAIAVVLGGVVFSKVPIAPARATRPPTVIIGLIARKRNTCINEAPGFGVLLLKKRGKKLKVA
ncbi:hypothetical protein DEU56DRAFT_358076 [Suillus clintonianus]|uniref:uncharacterized protein n=1 Tax=Suillus clintonianus TaxID=1904413 RepID=UPI001B85FE56|nr:uncharacterized protein DEU56DRAFT_358076 [Suillus clintonianus]KAG2136668.1 hypothetical protein DEU56DRAFT_358076 [Suillus clintonianus]